MENLLDDIDGLVAPGLSTETPDWCVNCQSLRQELKQLKEEHGQNFGRLKQKIINTDLLIKKFKTKCDDYDLQCKRTDEAHKSADKYRRQCEILETQLKAALLDTEPLRKATATLEEQLNVKKKENQTLSDRLIATEGAQRQYEHLAKANSVSVERLESEKKELVKKVKLLESGKISKETVKELRNEITMLKKENDGLKKDNTSLITAEEKLGKKLELANKHIEELNKSLNEKGKSPKIRRRNSPVKSPYHSPRFGRLGSPKKSPINKRQHLFQPGTSHNALAPPTQSIRKLVSDDESSFDDTDDNESLCSVTWTFSPITQCISPLPPSPACFVDQNDVDGNDSDIADDLEQQLLDFNEDNKHDNEELEATLTLQSPERSEDLTSTEPGIKTVLSKVEAADINDNEHICDSEINKDIDSSDIKVNELIEMNAEVNMPENTENARGNEKCVEKKYCGVREMEESSNLGLSNTEKITGALVSTKSLKGDSSHLIKAEGNETNINPIKTVTRAPAIRRSARIKSKLDSETSEAESDIDQKKKDIHPASQPSDKKEDSASCSETPDALSKDLSESISSNRAVLKDVEKIIESDVLEKPKVDNSYASSLSSLSVKMQDEVDSEPLKSKNNANDLSATENIVHTCDPEKFGNADKMKEKTDKLDVKDDVHTKTDVSKPVPKQTCLVRQEAVSVNAGPSHLFEDQQTTRGKREVVKDKFGPYKFIPFQRSSAGTLSNEIDDLNYLNDYELLSREQGNNQDIQKPELSSKYKKKLRKKIRKNCKYRDRDSEFHEKNSMTTNWNQSYTPNDTNIGGSNTDSEVELRTNEKSIANETTDTNANLCVSSFECDLKEAKEQLLVKKDKSGGLHNDIDANIDKDKAVLTEDKMAVVEEVVNDDSVTCATSNKGLEASNSLQVPENSKDDESDKISPTRQLSTGFSVNSLSLERMSSTESGVSLRSSPAKLFVLEPGSCDTIIEDREENQNSKTIDKKVSIDESDDKHIYETAGNIIFGVEDILDDEHDNFNDTTEHQSQVSLELNCNEYKSNTVTPDVSVKSDIHSTNPQIFTSYMKPESLEHNSEIICKSEEVSFMETDDKNFEISGHSGNVAGQFATVEDDSSRSSIASLGTLGSDSPMSDMFLSRFDFLNPVSPLPPSPVKELEDEVDDELGKKVVKEENELTDEPVLNKGEQYSNNDIQDISDELCNNKTINNSHESKTKGKALQKTIKSSVLTPNASVYGNVKIESDSANKNLTNAGKLTHVKVENLKMSPLPGMISPVKSPVVRHSQIKHVKSVHNARKNIKIERNIMDECDKRFKTEVDDAIVITRSKLSVNRTNGNTSPVTVGKFAKKRTSLVRKSGNGKCSNSDIVPVRKSALVEKILRKKAEVSKDKNAINTQPIIDKSVVDSSIHAEYHNTPKDLKPSDRTMNAKSDVEPKATPGINMVEKGDHSILEELPTGHDNLAFKKKTRVAHKPSKSQKVPIIDAPPLPPVLPGRKRRSADSGNKDTKEKKSCKQSSFRKQKTDSSISKEDTKRMQTFLKSPETAEHFVSMVTEVHGERFVGNVILLSCLECIGRVMTDPLDVVFENCVTDAYLDIHTDFPFLSDVEKRAVYLIRHLQDNKFIKKAELMRNAWDTVLCRNLTVNVIGKMAQCRLFIALCAVQGDLELARLMLYQLVTCTHINFILFLVPVVSVWPEILRKNPADRPDSVVSHGLILVLEELITERLQLMEDELSKKILIVLKKLCLWSGVCGNAELVLKTLFVKLHNSTCEESVNDLAVFELTTALNLLCASKQWTWVKVNFIDRHGLQTASNKYTAKLITKPISPKYMCAVLRVTSYVLNAHASTIRERDYQHVIKNWLLPILCHKPGNDQVLVCCLETLIELSPLYPSCLDMIQNWFHQAKCNISTELIARLEDLRTQYKQQYGLICKPFVKS